MQTRTVKFLDDKNEWKDILPENIKKGMKIKMFEPDGEELKYFGGLNCFIAVSNSYLENDAWTFKVDNCVVPVF